jgi:DMSO/TMAO reductase YedYZ molybdopterin-dependent catalytic subunit
MFNDRFTRRELEQQVRSEGRLPPGQSLTRKFPVLHYGPTPSFAPETWDFRVYGEVEEPFTLNWEDFNRLPRTKIEMDIHCVTAWSKFDTVWEGVSCARLINHGLQKLKPEAHFVVQHAEYGFTTNMPSKWSLRKFQLPLISTTTHQRRSGYRCAGGGREPSQRTWSRHTCGRAPNAALA